MSCERSIFDGTFSRLAIIDILVFSDGMVPQVSIAWNGNNDLEMLRQFWDRMGQPHLSLIITHNGLGFESLAGIFPAACGVNYSRERVHS